MQHNKDSDGQSAYDYTQEDDRMVEPSAEPRAPQLNGTICGCNCSQRGFVDGDSERDDQTRDKDVTYLGGQEGVESHMLIEDQVQHVVHERLEPFTVRTRYAEYEIGHDGIVLEYVYDFESTTDGFPLRRIGSGSSMFMQVDHSGEISMASSSVLSHRPESPGHMVFGTDTWANAVLDTRSGYHFIALPLQLSAPLRCCSCRSGTSTESDTNSNSSLYRTDSSDFSEDGVADPSRI